MRKILDNANSYELLCVFSMNVGRVMTYDSLIRQVWNESDSGDTDRVRTFVKQLRRKHGDDPAWPLSFPRKPVSPTTAGRIPVSLNFTAVLIFSRMVILIQASSGRQRWDTGSASDLHSFL